MKTPTPEAAHAIGASGSPPIEAERLAFEAWMRGHCWALSATWTGTQYLGSSESSGYVCPHAMGTRRMWAAWRDRAALAQPGTTDAALAALRRLDDACDARAKLLTPEAYNAAIVADGMKEALEELDDARREARAILTTGGGHSHDRQV